MKNPSCFGTLEEWKTALMLLPDENFFELMRSVFGNIKTPFSKQRLMEDLFSLLSRGEIRSAIAAYIDEKDHKVIAAVALLRSPVPRDLENFFSGEFSYGELHSVLRNLEERLILYRFQDGEERRVALNPALKNILAPFASDTAPLFPSVPLNENNGEETNYGSSGSFMPDGRAMAALFSFIEAEENFLKAEGGIRKKILDEWKRFFPALDPEPSAALLVKLGLFYPEGEALRPDRKRIRDYSFLSPRERRQYWAAAFYLHKTEGGRENFGFSRLKETAALIHGFMGLLDPSRLYPKITLRRKALLLVGDNSAGGVWGRRLFRDSDERIEIDPFLETLEKCGLINTEGDFSKFIGNETDGRAACKEGSTVIAMDSAFSFVLYPEIEFQDALELASFCSIKAGGGFELTRASAIRSFDQGKKSGDIVELLKRLSGGRIDSNLEWTIKDWESRYASVSLYRGEVLVLSEEKRYLAKAPPLSSMISKTLAEGVYLLSSGDRRQITQALRKAGVDIFSQPAETPFTENKKNAAEKIRPGFFPSLGKKSVETPLAPDGDESAGENAGEETAGTPVAGKRKSDNPSALKERFNRFLAGMKLSDTDRKELASRIERRLIFTETQLEDASLKYEKLEAHGLDYTGKAVLARQAIAARSLLEISLPGPEGTVKTAAGIPVALEKKDGENYLILNSPETKEGELRFPLGKIGRLRRIKESIFEK